MLSYDVQKEYEVGKRLGRGAVGEVFAIKGRRNGQMFAMKVISRDLLSKQIETEIRVMKLRHPNILQLYDFNQSYSNCYLIVELCAGGDLQKYLLRRTRLPEPVANKFFYQIASGLQFLHENRVAHRDLKPANILLSCDSENAIIKIGDFGLSKIFDSAAIAQTLCGTPLYTAPEILNDCDGYNPLKVDLWSAGCIYFEILTGVRAFTGRNNRELRENVNKFAVSDAKIPKSAKPIILKLLQSNPDNRISSKELKERVYKFLSMDDRMFVSSLDPSLYEKESLDESNITDVGRSSTAGTRASFLVANDSISASHIENLTNKLIMLRNSDPNKWDDKIPQISAANVPKESIYQNYEEVIDAFPLWKHQTISSQYSSKIDIDGELETSRSDGLISSICEEDEFVLIHTVQDEVLGVRQPVGITETEHKNMEEEQHMKIQIFYLNGFYAVYPYVYELGILGDAFASVAFEMERGLTSIEKPSESDMMHLKAINHFYKISLATYLHASMFLSDLTKKLQDLMKSITMASHEMPKLQFICRNMERMSNMLMKRVTFYHDHHIGNHLSEKTTTTAAVHSYDIVQPEPILYQLASSFLKDATTKPETARSQELLKLAQAYADMINLTVQKVEDRAVTKELGDAILKLLPRGQFDD